MAMLKKETRGRKFNAAKYAITRAWEIAKNATVAHNTNPINVAKSGLAKPSEFFKESLVIAWREAKAKATKQPVEFYKLHKVPKKNQKKILNAIDMLIETKAVIGVKPENIEIAQCVFDARFSTPAARSTNRHILHALPEIANTQKITAEVKAENVYA